MSFKVTCRIKRYIQPFERELGLRELECLAGSPAKPVMDLGEQPECFRVASRLTPGELARELAFWEAVCGDGSITTTQSLREATVNLVRNGISLEELAARLPFRDSVPLPNRRCLRYGSHGLHEYRGKFFPQLVRAFINIGGVPRGGLVADPFCGSGTSAVEAILAGRDAWGLDMNPLSVFMARTKCGVLSVGVEDLEKCYGDVRKRVLNGSCSAKAGRSVAGREACDTEYLAGWFDARILAELEYIRYCVVSAASGAIRDFFLLSLSNILRRVSWQKEDDLRIRKEVKTADEIDPVREFLEEVGRSVRLLLAFLRQSGSSGLGRFDVREGDSRKLADEWKGGRRKADVIITSPPYATALPYLDTDRLSLCFLGLLPRDLHRERDQAMIGNREITNRTRRDYWGLFNSDGNGLPRSVKRLISEIQTLNQDTDAGFRRRNLPSLLYKYFEDMRHVFAGMREILKPHGSSFVVVGNNHTLAGGKRVEITTVRLLADVAEAVGFEVVEEIPMEMLVSREIFKKNAIESESILHLRNPR
jgi:DNA modification methylase